MLHQSSLLKRVTIHYKKTVDVRVLWSKSYQFGLFYHVPPFNEHLGHSNKKMCKSGHNASTLLVVHTSWPFLMTRAARFPANSSAYLTHGFGVVVVVRPTAKNIGLMVGYDSWVVYISIQYYVIKMMMIRGGPLFVKNLFANNEYYSRILETNNE